MRSLEGAPPAQPMLRDHPVPVDVPPSKGSVLVVDDEPMVVRAVSLILERSGYVVRTADGPSDAMARFEEAGGAIDLLLTDVVMPEGGGRRLADRLIERCPTLRVLFMSGFTEHDSVRDDRELPATLLTKPFNAAKLEAAVRRALE
jgi:two-component system cell cycle sensor histidine kinase/response regulator CckA